MAMLRHLNTPNFYARVDRSEPLSTVLPDLFVIRLTPLICLQICLFGAILWHLDAKKLQDAQVTGAVSMRQAKVL